MGRKKRHTEKRPLLCRMRPSRCHSCGVESVTSPARVQELGTWPLPGQRRRSFASSSADLGTVADKSWLRMGYAPADFGIRIKKRWPPRGPKAEGTSFFWPWSQVPRAEARSCRLFFIPETTTPPPGDIRVAHERNNRGLPGVEAAGTPEATTGVDCGPMRPRRGRSRFEEQVPTTKSSPSPGRAKRMQGPGRPFNLPPRKNCCPSLRRGGRGTPKRCGTPSS